MKTTSRSKKLRIILIVTPILLLTFYIGLYVAASNSEPYHVARQFLHANGVAKNSLGDISTDRLAFVGYEVRYKGVNGTARFEIVLSSTAGPAKAFVKLNRKLGSWAVTEAALHTPDSIVLDLFADGS